MSLKPSTGTAQTPAPDAENSAAPAATAPAADAPTEQAGAKGGKSKDKKA